MEVEAKFSILDERMFRQLLAACSLAGFRLADASVAKFHDQYLDTAGRTILAAGYGCRLRITDGHYLLTVKNNQPTLYADLRALSEAHFPPLRRDPR